VRLVSGYALHEHALDVGEFERVFFLAHVAKGKRIAWNGSDVAVPNFEGFIFDVDFFSDVRWLNFRAFDNDLSFAHGVDERLKIGLVTSLWFQALQTVFRHLAFSQPQFLQRFFPRGFFQ